MGLVFLDCVFIYVYNQRACVRLKWVFGLYVCPKLGVCCFSLYSRIGDENWGF